MKIRIGISTCPNDTFAFFPLLERRIDTDGFDFEFELLDVQELNRLLAAGQLDVGKASFHAALKLADRYGVFPAGSALGFGNGPLLLAAREGSRLDAWESAAGPPVVLCPGADTTAYLLYQLFYPGSGRVEQVVFSEIAASLLAGRADFGVCIHEGRFTYRRQGLSLVEDLGQRWERETGLPLPLGGILGRWALGDEVLARLSRVIGTSVAYALGHRTEALPTMQRYAQEMDPAVIWSHVDLYVNRWTEDLGQEGWRSLECLSRMAQRLSGAISGQLRRIGQEPSIQVESIMR